MGKNKNKLRTLYTKTHENFKNSKPRVQFYWLLQKNSIPQQEEGNYYSVIRGVLYRSGDATCFFYFQNESPFVYQVINKTKLYFSKTKSLKH